jgi:hypothetical protein
VIANIRLGNLRKQQRSLSANLHDPHLSSNPLTICITY